MEWHGGEADRRRGRAAVRRRVKPKRRVPTQVRRHLPDHGRREGISHLLLPLVYLAAHTAAGASRGGEQISARQTVSWRSSVERQPPHAQRNSRRHPALKVIIPAPTRSLLFFVSPRAESECLRCSPQVFVCFYIVFGITAIGYVLSACAERCGSHGRILSAQRDVM